ncbi:CDGSH iron-sulfur domain-containing protein [bacterium]|nr:CDGSH iron-sulfur domain-containing protein [bacterium]
MSWQSSPYKIDAKSGQTLAFCTCGQSKNPPFCDGSHKGSGKAPNPSATAPTRADFTG